MVTVIKEAIHQPDKQNMDLMAGIKAVRHLHYRVITETGLTIFVVKCSINVSLVRTEFGFPV